MHWFRSNTTAFVRLALFALAVQVVITFGHVHLDDLALASTQVTQFSADQGSEPLGKIDSKDQTSHGRADTGCPICALIQLASTSAPSVAPLLPVPTTLPGTILETSDTPGFGTPRAFAFQARGPPFI